LELLLVLALLAALAAMAWPALKRPMANQRLRSAADAVRAAWGRARVQAMESGQTVLFQYTIDGDSYSIQYRAGSGASSDLAPNYAPDATIAQASGLAGGSAQERTLPKGVVFVGGETADQAGGLAVASQMEPLGGEAMGWSQPILFYPDGTTSDARLVLKNEYDRSIEISLRGMTGVVTIGETFSAEESLP
jgi:type II secretory pathway pseudopilin PulG